MKPPHPAAARMAAECLCFRARRASRTITRMYDDALRPFGLRATQLTLLNAIALVGSGSGAPMPRLAAVLAMDATTLSRNLRPLIARRWVRLASAPEDARSRLAWLTAAGERMIADALPVWTAAHEKVLSTLGPDAADGLRTLFDATAESADAPAHTLAAR